MDVFLLILGILCMLTGLAGSVLPILPGLPVAYLGFIFLQISRYGSFSPGFLIIWAVIVIAMAIIDYLIPKWGTKKYGGTTWGQNGALIGTIAGIFIFPPFGLILGPFAGAFFGELLHDANDRDKALRSAWGSFMGFLAGTLVKVLISVVMCFYFVREWVK